MRQIEPAVVGHFPICQPNVVYGHIVELEKYYPHLENWFWDKVVPELGASRSIFHEWCDGQLAGLVIAKRESNERKLCTVWVAPKLRRQGLGARLMRDAMEWLGTDKPMITVPRARLAEFRPILGRWRFSLDQTLDSYYRPGETEYVFNGALPDVNAS